MQQEQYYPDFIAAKSVINSTIIADDPQHNIDANMIKHSLICSMQMRNQQLHQQNPAYINEPIEEVETDFEGMKMFDYRVSGDIEINEKEADLDHSQSIIGQSRLFTQAKKITKQTGYLEKKSQSILRAYKKYYCILDEGILLLYESEQSNRAKIVLNFNLFGFKYFKLEQNDKVIEFGLRQNEIDKVFQFKGECVQQFFSSIKQLIDQQRIQPKYNYLLHGFEDYYKKNLIHHQHFLTMVESGDLILFQGKNITAKVQRMLTQSDYDHVAMILKYSNGEIYAMEATGSYGVGVFKWDHMINKGWVELYNKIVYRKLEVKRDTSFLLKLEAFVRENLGKKYKLSVSKLLQNQSVIMGSSIQQTNNQTYFCSQLIAAAYKHIGVLKTQVASSQFWPGSFSNEKEDIKLTDARLSDEYLIGFNM